MKYSVASIKSLKVSPRKLSLVANLIRNIGVADALKRLTFCEKTSANEVKKCLSSALAIAELKHFFTSLAELFAKKLLLMK